MAVRALRGRAAHRARLSVEALESREGPSSLFGIDGADLSAQLPGTPGGPVPVPGGPPGGPGPVVAPAPNQAPSISGFKAIVGPNGQVTFTGTVTDDQAVAGLVVVISGTGFSVSAIVDDDGNFRTTTQVFGMGEITATAKVTDAQGATGESQTTFTPTP